MKSPLCFLLLWAVPLVAGVGCGAKSPPAEETAAYVRSQLDDLSAPVAGKSIVVTNVESVGNPPRWLASIQVEDELKDDLYVRATLDEAFAHYAYDPQTFQKALERVALLRMPERAAVVAKSPKPAAFGALFRRTAKSGAPVAWTGKLYAELRDGRWHFSDLKPQFPAEFNDERQVAKAKLAPEAIRIDGPGDANGVVERIDQERNFVKLLESAEAKVVERLEAEKKRLFAASEPGKSWVWSVDDRSGTSTSFRASFIQRSDDGSQVLVLITNASNPLERGVWTGAIELAPAPTADDPLAAERPNPDGWLLRLAASRAGRAFPVHLSGSGLRLTAASDGQLTAAGANPAVAWTPDEKAPKIASLSTFTDLLAVGCKPGEVWEGELRVRDEPARDVRLTFLENRDDGQYVRTVLEAPALLHAPIVLQGTAGMSREEAVGRPVRLKPVKQMNPGELKYHPHEIELMLPLNGEPMLQNAELKLKRAAPIKDYAASPARWQRALQPGTVWNGKYQHVVPEFRGTTCTFKLTVAEVRNDLGYVRVVIEGDSDSSQFRVLEGSVKLTDEAIDDFALVLRAKTSSRNHPPGIIVDWWHAFFGTRLDDESVHRFRILPSGEEMVGVSSGGEIIELKRDADAETPAIDRASMVANWREHFTPAQRWQGMIRSRSLGAKEPIELAVKSGPNDVDEVEVLVRHTKSKFVAAYKGTLRPDSDVNANGYALQLKKQGKGVGKSLVFGEYDGIELEFRLDAAGPRLLGVARGTHGTHMPWDEILELQPQTAAKAAKP